MHPDLEHLAALDAIDRELDQLDLALKQSQDAQSATNQEIAAIDIARAGLLAHVEASRGRQREAEARGKGHRERMKSAQQALATGVGDYQVAERQIAEYTRLLDADETAVLEELERQDGLAAELAANDQARTTASAKLAQWVANRPGLEAQTTTRRGTLHATRAAHHGALPTDLRNRYDGLRGRGKRAIARIADGACGACSQHVQDQQRIEIGRGRIEVCRGCHRWLVLA